MLDFVGTHPEVDEWVKQTVTELSPAQLHTQGLLDQILYSAYEPDEDYISFQAYLDHLAGREPNLMRNRFLTHMFPNIGEAYAERNQLMNLETFIAEIDRSEMDHVIEDDLFAEAYALLSDLSAMRGMILSHLTTMWREFLAVEWERNKAFLNQVVESFQRFDFSGQNAYEAIQSITGRDVRGSWQKVLSPVETLVFIPSPHIGPYLLHYAYGPVVRIVFGARLPQVATSGVTKLTRTDMLVQLRILADDTRLRILELLFKEGELFSQEVVTRLNLSKSSGSRHLSQLSATGYLVEHQRTGKAKSYALNPDSFRAILDFLERYAQS
jgi:DNA-binding transcriptional ArsR family regulator